MWNELAWWDSVSPGPGKWWQEDMWHHPRCAEREASQGYESLFVKYVYSYTHRKNSLGWNGACFFSVYCWWGCIFSVCWLFLCQLDIRLVHLGRNLNQENTSTGLASKEVYWLFSWQMCVCAGPPIAGSTTLASVLRASLEGGVGIHPTSTYHPVSIHCTVHGCGKAMHTDCIDHSHFSSISAATRSCSWEGRVCLLTECSLYIAVR